MRASTCAFSIRSRATSRPRCRRGYSVGEDNDGGLPGHVDEMVIIVGANGVADSDQVLLLCHSKSECIANVNTAVAPHPFAKTWHLATVGSSEEQSAVLGFINTNRACGLFTSQIRLRG